MTVYDLSWLFLLWLNKIISFRWIHFVFQIYMQNTFIHLFSYAGLRRGVVP